eukprot:gene40247-49043_t
MVVNLIAGCLGGLEAIVVEDLKDKFGSAVLDMRIVSEKTVKFGEAACGKIWISLTDVAIRLDSIRSVQFWLVALFEGEIGGEGLSEELPSLTAHLTCATLGQVLGVWKALTTASIESSTKVSMDSPVFTFWVRCVRSGEHKFTSVDLASSLGGHVKDTMKWPVSVKHPSLTISVIVAYSKVCVGLLLPIGAKASPKSHLPQELHPPVLQVSHTTNLRPSTAYVMLKLAKLQPYEVVVDAMCGPGAGLLEGAFGHCGVSIGGDVNIGLKSSLLQATQSAAQMSNNRAVAE